MKEFRWQHITFADGSNPFICTTEKAFQRLRRKHHLVKLQDNFWYAKQKARTQCDCVQA